MNRINYNTTGFKKRAVIRNDGYPVGQPAPMCVNCGCGQTVPVVPLAYSRCKACGTTYDDHGWIIQPEEVTETT